MLRRSWVALVALLVARVAHAGGLFIPDSGAQPQARAGAFVAKADDATALAHNPAGLALLPGTQLYLDANFVRMSLSYTRSGRYEPTPAPLPPHSYDGMPYPTVTDSSVPTFGVAGFQPIPLIAVVTDLGGRLP